jgi:hypothetical protein
MSFYFFIGNSLSVIGFEDDKLKFLPRTMPKTPSQSVDIPSEEENAAVVEFPPMSKKDCKVFKPAKLPSVASNRSAGPVPVNRNISLSGQRIKKSVPQMVDECDLRKKPKKPVGNLPEIVKEGASELVHHPADVVIAAITIQRFFRRIKESKENNKKKLKMKKKKKLEEDDDRSPTTSDSSAYDTSDDDEPNASENSSSSSESESQVRRSSTPDSSDTESDQENLPNTGDSDVESSSVKHAEICHGVAAEEKLQENENEVELPDLTSNDVINSTIKIQSAFRGFQERKNIKQMRENHSLAKIASASMTIQRAYRRYRKRKVQRAGSPNLKQVSRKVRSCKKY